MVEWWIYLVVFAGKLIEVTTSSLRSQLVVKGQRVGGAVTAGFEYLFWFFITATVLEKYSSNYLMVFILALAYALGQVLGSLCEEHLALGVCMLTCVFRERGFALAAAKALREAGFALTLLPGSGWQGESRPIMMLTVKRSLVPTAKRILAQCDSHVVVTLTPSVQLEGGVLNKGTKDCKRTKRHSRHAGECETLVREAD